MTGQHWTDERIEKLRKLYADGFSCAQIAHQLGGVTRNSVIGKIHRLGFPLRGQSSGMVQARPKKCRPRKRPNKPFTFSPKAPPASEALRAIRMKGAPLPPPQETDVASVSTIALEEHHCRWPVGDPVIAGAHAPLFCGADRAGIKETGRPIPGIWYCEPHALRAFVPLPPRRRETAMPVPATADRVLEAA